MRTGIRHGWPSGSAGIVESRGKMHNPETESGGVLLGTVTAVGERHESPPAIGERIVTLGSLTLTPLRARRGQRGRSRLDPGRGVGNRVRLRAGRLGARSRRPAADDAALEIYDVCAAASQTRALAPRGGTVCVLGAGHAGKLALAAARDATAGGTLVAVDIDAARDRAGRWARALRHRGRQPTCATRSAPSRPCGRRVRRPADLTVVVVNATGCEPTAILLTADGGHGALLLDGDELLGGRPGRRRDRARACG